MRPTVKELRAAFAQLILRGAMASSGFDEILLCVLLLTILVVLFLFKSKVTTLKIVTLSVQVKAQDVRIN